MTLSRHNSVFRSGRNVAARLRQYEQRRHPCLSYFAKVWSISMSDGCKLTSMMPNRTTAFLVQKMLDVSAILPPLCELLSQRLLLIDNLLSLMCPAALCRTELFGVLDTHDTSICKLIHILMLWSIAIQNVCSEDAETCLACMAWKIASSCGEPVVIWTKLSIMTKIDTPGDCTICSLECPKAYWAALFLPPESSQSFAIAIHSRSGVQKHILPGTEYFIWNRLPVSRKAVKAKRIVLWLRSSIGPDRGIR